MSYECGDCGKTTGEYHVDSCDIERCPKCSGQLLSCDCKFPMMSEGYLIDSNKKKWERIKVKNSIDEDFGGEE